MTVKSIALRFAQALSLSALALLMTPSFAQSRYTVSADGQEVIDSKTNLVWRRCAEGMKFDGTTCIGKALALRLPEAKTLCASAGKSDGKLWRVPFKDELMSLVDRTQKKKPKTDIVTFPGTPSTIFWALRPGFDDNLNAWLVNFANGKVYGNTGERKNNLRLVRTGD
jgi:hypothetical protein